MAIPDFQSLMKPLLEYLVDGKEKNYKQTLNHLSELFEITEEEKKILIPSKKHTLFYNRLYWSKLYLQQANLLEKTRRGFFCITNAGKKLLDKKPIQINTKYLKSNYPVFKQWIDKGSEDSVPEISKHKKTEVEIETNTPEEQIEISYKLLRNNLVSELAEQVKSISPQDFERLVVELLVAMGYGGSLKEAGEVIGKSGDEGIDGIIKEDKLGLDVIYIQAKRWKDATIGRPEIQKFAGALDGKRAKKGIFITTANFSSGATHFANDIEKKIILIDGDKLANLMIDYNIGVSLRNLYEIKKIDMDYFDEIE